jgi:hypothetical protein
MNRMVDNSLQQFETIHMALLGLIFLDEHRQMFYNLFFDDLLLIVQLLWQKR